MDNQVGSQQSVSKEKGQILVLVAIMLVAMLAMLALVLDGGTAYAKRREAQNAADAGALAGARVYCETQDSAQAIAAGILYAEDRNGATNATAQAAGAVVTVTAQITTPTYFAHLIGFPEVGVTAVAAAGCEVPSTGNSILPIAWACHRPPIEEGQPITSTECLDDDELLTEDELQFRLNNPPPSGYTIWPEMFILMDSQWQEDDLSFVCAPPAGSSDTATYPGVMDCDLDNDGDNDIAVNGDRSWLDLNGGGGGASELSNWIADGFPGNIDIHDWVGGQPGAESSVYQTAGTVAGKIYAVPIFDQICRDTPNTGSCIPPYYHPAEDNIITTAGGNYYYHVSGFGAFYITCVEGPGVKIMVDGREVNADCPGHNYADSLGIFGNGNEPPTIEGYFVYGVFSNLDSIPYEDPDDSGAYVIRLYK